MRFVAASEPQLTRVKARRGGTTRREDDGETGDKKDGRMRSESQESRDQEVERIGDRRSASQEEWSSRIQEV